MQHRDGNENEKSARENGEEKRKGANVDILTRGSYVGLMLTQLPHRIKPGSKPPNDLK